MSRINDSRAWTDLEHAALDVMYRAAVIEREAQPRNRWQQPPPIDYAAIGAVLGRTATAVQGEATRRGLTRKAAQLRACLGPLCEGQRQFYSEGVGNRLCPRCLDAAELRCA